MKNIELNGKSYQIKTEFSELLTKEYYKLTSVLRKEVRESYTEEEQHKLDTFSDKGKAEELVGKLYTEEDKIKDVIRSVSNIPKKMLNKYPKLLDIVSRVVITSLEDLLKVEHKIREYYLINNKRYYVNYEPSTWIFQEWCDFDGFTQGVNKPTRLGFMYNEAGILAGHIRPKNRPYDRFHSDFNMLYSELSKMPAIEVVGTLNKLLENVSEVRKIHDFIYGDFEGEPVKPAMAEHLRRTKWEDTIVQLAELPVFNSMHGTLYAIRNENALTVLNYLNTKRSRENAEYQDYLKSTKKSQVNL